MVLYKFYNYVEFPSVIVDAKSLETISEFDTFVRPEINKLNSICIETTGIQQVVNKLELLFVGMG